MTEETNTQNQTEITPEPRPIIEVAPLLRLTPKELWARFREKVIERKGKNWKKSWLK